MTAPEGGFYSAEDADSEGEEGRFYVWAHDEIKQVLNPGEVELFMKAFNIEEKGNFANEIGGRRTGGNIPHLAKSLLEIASELNLSVPELETCLEAIRQKLFAYRDERVHPYKDDKVLADWNALMIAALAKAARVLDEPGWVSAAKRAVDFILKNMLTSEGRLLHRYREGEAALPAHVDDYAFLIHAMLELYQTTFEVSYLKWALELNQCLLEHFWDDSNGGFYFAA